MRDTEGMKLWLFDLAHNTGILNNEKVVQGFLKHYALHGLTVWNVRQDIIFHTEYGAENCEYAMQTLTGALEWFANREESRTLTEVRQIIDATKAGLPVQVGYYDGDMDDDPMVVRKQW